MSLTATPPTMYDVEASPALTDTELILLIKEDGQDHGLEISDRLAGYILEMMERAVHTIRSSPDDIYILTELDMRLAHPVLEAIMPDNVTEPASDSAHYALNRRFLSGPNMCIQHTFAENHASGARECAMAIAVISSTVA